MLRVATRCSSLDQFVEAFAPLSDARTLFIASMTTRDPGTRAPFSILLADGTRVMRGQCEVLEAFASPDNPFRRPGVKLQLLELDPDGEAVVARLAQARARRASPPPPMRPGTSTVPPVAGPPAPPPLAVIPPPIPLSPLPPPTPPLRADATPPPSLLATRTRPATNQVVPAGSAPIKVIRVPDPAPAPADDGLASAGGERVPGAALVLPANPLTNLTDDSLEGFVECTLYEDTGAVELDGAAAEDPADPVSPPPDFAPIRPTRAGSDPSLAPVATSSSPPPAPVTMVPGHARMDGDDSVDDAIDLTELVAKARAPRRTAWVAAAAAVVVIAGAAFALGRATGGSSASSRAAVAPAAASTTTRVVAAPAPSAAPAPVEPSTITTPAPVGQPAVAARANPPAAPTAGRAVATGATEVEAAAPASSGPCSLRVTTLPAGTPVTIDGTGRGVTPVSLSLPCGARRIGLGRPRYLPVERELSLVAGAPEVLELVHQRPQHFLQITSNPAGAEVRVDGRVVGRSPVRVKVTGFERHKVELSRAGFAPVQQAVYSRSADQGVSLKLTRVGAARTGQRPR